MADLVIRGMEMPETCGLCQLCLDDSRICNGYCMFFHRRVNMMERDKNCPIIPLPEGHGRLIDAEAYVDYMQNRYDNNEITNGDWIDFRLSLKDQPTIVPAEGGTDECSEN